MIIQNVGSKETVNHYTGISPGDKYPPRVVKPFFSRRGVKRSIGVFVLISMILILVASSQLLPHLQIIVNTPEVFSYKEGLLNVNFDNPKTNAVGVRIQLSVEGNIVYLSEILAPGNSIGTIPIDINLNDGKYLATLQIITDGKIPAYKKASAILDVQNGE